MKKPVLSYLVAIPLFFALSITAQSKSPVKFGDVSAKDFDISGLKVDTTLGAVILSDIGVSSFEGNSKGWFNLLFKRKRRILILNKQGFGMATVTVPLYNSTRSKDEEKMEKLKGATYNLVNGVVTHTDLNADGIFKERYDKNHTLQKFTFPEVKEGSILEYSYTINSDFLFNLQPWEFQGKYPCLWSEYEVDLPSFFEYIILKQGYLSYDITEHPAHNATYDVIVRRQGGMAGSLGIENRDAFVSIDATVTNYRWVMKNVPALKEEKYTTTINNHIAKLEFQMSSIKFSNQPAEDYMENWKIVGNKLLQNDDFGSSLKKNNNWLDDEIKPIVQGVSDPLEKAKKIFYYVRDNFTVTSTGWIYLSQPLKDIFKAKKGSVADVNLLLVTMLNHEGLNADPVILSTTGHGVTKEAYPILSKYNYVVAQLSIGEKQYYLDATKSQQGFGHLPAYCYNGHARVITADASAVYFNPDTLQENRTTNIMLFSDDKLPGNWQGNYKTILGYNQSEEAREQIRKSKEAYEQKLSGNLIKAYDVQYEELDNFEEPLTVSYSIKLGNSDKTDLIYLNPMLTHGYTENPFKAAERTYPVEIPYRIDDTYYLNVEVPAGYEIEELPKATKIMLGESKGYFEYLLAKTSDGINLKARLKLEKVVFEPGDYETLRNFFAMIVKKESEQIVFKKKK